MGKFQQHAIFERKQAWVGGEFGEKYARAKFGDEVVNALPVKSRGKYEGKINASIEWVKVKQAGFVSTRRPLEDDQYAPGYIEKREGQIIAVILYSDTYRDGFVIHGILGDTNHFADELRAANQKKVA